LITCINCGNKFEGKYCSNCKQPAINKRVTWLKIIHDLQHALFHTDKGLLYTIKELTIRPGHTIRDYLNGKRVYHFNPFLFMILTGGFASFLFVSLRVKLLNKEIDLDVIEQVSATLAHKYFAIMSGLILLLLAITDYVFYRSKKYLFPELIVSNTFQAGQILVFLIALFPLLLLQNYVEHALQIHIVMRPFIKLVIIVYFFFVRYQFYEARGNYKLIITIACQLLLVYFLFDFAITRLIVYLLK
jgi:Protein of unknown function (DUF3667)